MKSPFALVRSRPFIKRLGLVVGVITGITAIVFAMQYNSRPRIIYTARQADCTQAATANRNQKLGAELKSCVIVIDATNLKNKTQYVDYDGVGGGFAGSSKPLIRIYSADGQFCYASVGSGSSFAPKETKHLSLQCTEGSYDEKNYDPSSGNNPVLVEIDGYSGATLPLNVAR